ncbi:MAG TPA: carboxypeptidase regulatory-like domain-containing protein [Chitinispirillaceae bacterium]|nr:carboxypeptidase regulatory-like domain-containing protein [Chitinispirillaceae bacterium]
MHNRLILTLIGIGFLIGTSLGTTVSGTVTDSAATTPVNKAVVQVRSGNLVLGADTTDEQGAYSITVTDSTGNCSVRASLSGTYNSKSVDTVLSSTPLTINIAISKIITTTLSGVVSDSIAGTPLAGAIVRIGNMVRDTTGADGAYSFAAVRTGNQSIQASLAGFVSKTTQISVTSADPVTVNIALVKTAYVNVSGIVKDSATGTTLAGAVVSLGSGMNPRVDTTSADGAFSFDSVPSGSQTLRVSMASYNNKTVQLSVGSEAVTADLALVATVYGSISGIVSDSTTGLPLTGAIVQIGNSMTLIDTTGTDGAYSIANVQTGTQTVKASVSKYTTKTSQVTVAENAVATTNFALIAIIYGSISGVITDSAKATPLAGAIVRLGNSFNGRVDTTGADGVYSFTDVPVGNQTVSVTFAKYAGKSTQVAVADTTPVKQDFALVALILTSVSGIVTDSANGTPLAGVEIRIGANGNFQYDTTGTDGKYQFAEVSIGSAPMKISATGFMVHRDTLTLSGTEPVNHNIALGGKTAIITKLFAKNSTAPHIVLSGDRLAITNVSSAGKLSIFSLNGKCVYKAVFDNSSASVTLPSNILSGGLSLIAQITINNRSWTQQILSTR